MSRFKVCRNGHQGIDLTAVNYIWAENGMVMVSSTGSIENSICIEDFNISKPGWRSDCSLYIEKLIQDITQAKGEIGL